MHGVKKNLRRLAVHQKFFARLSAGHLWSIESIPKFRHHYIFQNGYGGICQSPQSQCFEESQTFRGLFLLKNREGFYDADPRFGCRQRCRGAASTTKDPEAFLHHQSSIFLHLSSFLLSQFFQENKTKTQERMVAEAGDKQCEVVLVGW